MPVPAPKNTKFTPKIWRETEDEVHLLEKYGSLGFEADHQGIQKCKLQLHDNHNVPN
jgi:hypothetical protein